MTAQQAERKTINTPVSYRVITANGSLVLCWKHVDAHRKAQEPRAVRLTGETFAVGQCDHCHPERA